MKTTVKIKAKIAQGSLKNKNVIEMFHGVLGTGEKSDLRLDIVYPKYLKIKEHSERFIKLLEALGSSSMMKNVFANEAAALAVYVGKLKSQFLGTFAAPPLEKLHPPPELLAKVKGVVVDYTKVTMAEYKKFAEVYGKIKNGCDLTNVAIVTCKNLIQHKNSLGDKDNLKDFFLTKTGGMTFAPLPELPLNFKQMYITDTIGKPGRYFILVILHKMLAITHDLYETLSLPDVDIDEFVQIIMESLGDVKKQIPRCDEAFDKIASSVSLLKGNFGDYYKDYVASNNPTIIMENFVLDVSKNTNSSPKVTMQFRKIISHYRNIAANRATSPQLKQLFGEVDKNMQELEKQSRTSGTQKLSNDTGSNDTDTGSKTKTQAEKRKDRNRKKKLRQKRKKIATRLEKTLEEKSLFDELELENELNGSSSGDKQTDRPNGSSSGELNDEPTSSSNDKPNDESNGGLTGRTVGSNDGKPDDESNDKPTDRSNDEPTDRSNNEPTDRSNNEPTDRSNDE